MRKLVAWATNKHDVDPRFPRFAVLFTDYSPEREQPLKTDLRVASCVQNLDAFADDWLAANIKRGWVAASSFRRPEEDAVERTAVATPVQQEPIAATAEHDDPVVPEPSTNPSPRLTITFARSSSPTFPLVRRRLDALAPLGSLTVTKDDKGRDACLELTVARGLVENARRIASLIAIVQRWKTSEVALDGDVLGRQQLFSFLSKLDRVRLCWLRRKAKGQECMPPFLPTRLRCASHRAFPGCRLHPQLPSHRGLRSGVSMASASSWTSRPSATKSRTIATVASASAHSSTPALSLQPSTACPIPWPPTTPLGRWSTTTRASPRGFGHTARFRPPTSAPPPMATIAVSVSVSDSISLALLTANAPAGAQPAQRSVPPTRYSDVLGQNAAVEAARDLIELPLKHADLFLRIGAKPIGHGIILAGPPGTGKTLLARAVAGECGAHIEIVNGPALLVQMGRPDRSGNPRGLRARSEVRTGSHPVRRD